MLKPKFHILPLLAEGRITSQYGQDWPLHCPSCDSTEGAHVSYDGPAPFRINTVKGDLDVMSDMLEFNGKTIGQCMVCDAEAPLEDWVYTTGIGNRRMWREPEAERDPHLARGNSWFDDKK